MTEQPYVDSTGVMVAEKKAQAERRTLRLCAWLNRQRLSPAYMAIEEQAAAFLVRLDEWANSTDASLVAPSFHLAHV